MIPVSNSVLSRLSESTISDVIAQIRTRHWAETLMYSQDTRDQALKQNSIQLHNSETTTWRSCKTFFVYGYFGILLYEIQSSDLLSCTEGHPQSLSFESFLSKCKMAFALCDVWPFLTAFDVGLEEPWYFENRWWFKFIKINFPPCI